MRRILALPVILLLAFPASAPAAVFDVPALFTTQIARAKSRHAPPVLLPATLTYDAAQLFATGGASRKSYDMELATVRRCGANACFVASFLADRGAQPSGRQKVSLAGGRAGFYTPLQCGGSCAPPQIQWVRKGVRYTIQAHVDTRRQMIVLANSALRAGPR
jgi:hypothetical protein